MQAKGRAGMGSRKHGKSGTTPKSPKTRLRMKMEAERDERRPRASGCVFGKVGDIK